MWTKKFPKEQIEDYISDTTQTALNTKIGVTQVTPVTLTSGGWTLVSGYYEYTYSNANILSTSIVDVIPDNTSIATVKAADVLPTTSSSAGSVKFYSTNAPASNITVTINIFN